MKRPDYFGKFIPRLLKDGETSIMTTNFGFASRSGVVVQIPVGRTSDGLTVPRPLWWVQPPAGKPGPAGWIHDELYWTQVTTRAQADQIFNEAMQVSCVGALKRRAIYRAVRLFGWWAWNQNAKAKAAGATRILNAADDSIYLARAGEGNAEGMA